MMVSGEPSLDVTPLKDLTLAWRCEKPDEYMCGYWPPPFSSFMLIMIIPPLVMMESLSCFWALHLRAP